MDTVKVATLKTVVRAKCNGDKGVIETQTEAVMDYDFRWEGKGEWV